MSSQEKHLRNLLSLRDATISEYERRKLESSVVQLRAQLTEQQKLSLTLHSSLKPERERAEVAQTRHTEVWDAREKSFAENEKAKVGLETRVKELAERNLGLVGRVQGLTALEMTRKEKEAEAVRWTEEMSKVLKENAELRSMCETLIGTLEGYMNGASFQSFAMSMTQNPVCVVGLRTSKLFTVN